MCRCVYGELWGWVKGCSQGALKTSCRQAHGLGEEAEQRPEGSGVCIGQVR